MFYGLFLLLLTTSLNWCYQHQDLDILSNKLIENINKLHTSWKAEKNFDFNTSISEIKKLFGIQKRLDRSDLELKVHDVRQSIPEFFDAREKWNFCKSLSSIKDQSNCGSCWAFGAVEAMSDRVCIHSAGTSQVTLSSQDLLTCCKPCGWGCLGGEPDEAWKYWNTDGIVTGGGFNSSKGCKSYSFPPCEHFTRGNRPQCLGLHIFTPKCKRTCDPESSKTYKEDLVFGQKPYRLKKDQRQIQLEVMKNGPVEVCFSVHLDFLFYKSGIYQRTSFIPLGGHAVKLIGWGIENGTSYWLLANSWNTDWGEKGYFRFLRGVDHCGIETDAVAALPKN